MGKVVTLPLGGQLLYASGSAAFTILERILLLYMPFYYLPPAELNLPALIPDGTYLGVFTVLGGALLIGRIFDGLADPLIASLSDNSRFSLGRRKLFLLIGGLTLTITTLLVFHPPYQTGSSTSNGFWLSLTMAFFYFFFTAYVNPYLALLPELGHTDSLRINLSTMIAFFGLIGMIMVTILFPIIAAMLQDGGIEVRAAYRNAVFLFVSLSLLLLYLAAFGFNENRHCYPADGERTGAWQSLFHTFSIKPFRIFLGGEMFLQFAMNLVTLGLIYYAVVLFQREERFMTILAGLTIGTALVFSPLVNRLAKQMGKKRIITSGVLCLTFAGLAIFLLSFVTGSLTFYLSLAMFALAGFPLAVLTILINPTIADMARADYYKTGRRREAMFFGARAIPLKLTIALAGVVFAFLLSTFGRDIAQSLGVQLSALAVAIASLCSYICFNRYPEEEVMETLKQEKA